MVPENANTRNEVQLGPLFNLLHKLPLDKEGLMLEDALRELGRSLGSSGQLKALLDKNNSKEYTELTSRYNLEKLTQIRRFETLLRTLLRTASSAKLSPSHKTAAYNALAACLNQYYLISMPKSVDFVPIQEIWMEAFEIFLTRSENSKAKPMKQLLVTLVKMLSSEHAEDYRSALVSNVASRTIRTIFAEDSSSSVKSAFQSLDYFLTKRLICIPDIFSTISQVKQWTFVSEPNGAIQLAKGLTIFSSEARQRAELTRHINELFFNTVQWIRYPDVVLAIGHFISTFFTLMREWCQYSNPSAWTDTDGLPIWVAPVRMSLKQQPELFEQLGLYVIPGLLRIDATDTAKFLNQLPLDELHKGKFITRPAADIHMSLLTARIAKEKPFRQVIRLTDPQNIGLSLLFHGDPLTRIRAFELATTSSSKKEPFQRKVLTLLKAALPYFHAEPTPKIRDDFLALMKRAWTRLMSSIVGTETLRRHNENNKTSITDTVNTKSDKLEAEPSQILSDEHLTFASWYLCYLVDELQPSASYQRHITALSMMKYTIEESSASPSSNSQSSKGLMPKIIRTPILSSRNLRLLFDLVTDPFEDVRQLAASILEIFSNLTNGFESPVNLSYRSSLEDAKESDFLENNLRLFENHLTLGLTRAARLMQKTGRSDHSDGFGRLCKLIECLRLILVRETRLEAFSDLENIYLVEYQDLISQILRICTSVWDSVKDVLCFDAPEGYEFDTDEGNETMIGTKGILSYCWRALKESSFLLQAIITCTPKSKIGRSLRHNDYKQIGELVLSELSQLRHRGAFSSVSLAFAACCVQCVQTGDTSAKKLPKEWFRVALAFIEKLSSALTRRSAGLPAMVTGILSAYAEGEFFDNVHLELQRIASQSVKRAEDPSSLCLPQVHALNCLKDIFVNSKFSISTEAHISKTLNIAVNCLDSDIWALRNSGLMLLKALVNRLNGGTDIASTKASSSHRQLSFLYAKYKNLPDLLMKLFNPPDHALLLIENDKSTTFQVQRVFPALEIVERLGVPNQYEREIKYELWQHIEGSVWPIRDKAAKATSALCPERDIPAEVRRILDAPWFTQNSLHGRLLYIRYLSSRIGGTQGSDSNAPSLPHQGLPSLAFGKIFEVILMDKRHLDLLMLWNMKPSFGVLNSSKKFRAAND
ncbi:MAG: hypothetical protein Q9167_002130 [Letrouitia subvulpina]